LGAALDGGKILVPDDDTEDDLDFLDATPGRGSLDTEGDLDGPGYADNLGEAPAQESSDDWEDDDSPELLSFGTEDDLPGQPSTTASQTSQDEDRVPVTETPASSSVSVTSSSPTSPTEESAATDLADLRAQAWDLAAAIAAD